jgi:hypothetical protein
MTRMRVDFNARGPRGLVQGSQRRADGPLELGAVIEVFDPAEDDMVFSGTVVELDPASGAVLVDVAWEPADPAQATLRADWAEFGVRLTRQELTIAGASAIAPSRAAQSGDLLV